MKRYLIFAAIGPFIGGFLLLLMTTYQSGYWTETNGGEVAKLLVVFVKSLQYNYLFGIVPSLMLSWLNSPQKIELNQVSASSSSSRRSICAM